MGVRGAKWRVVAGLTVATCLGMAAIGDAQFRSFSDHTRALLEGNWQSCREGDGQYGERVYDGKWTGLEPFELHMGPYHEFDAVSWNPGRSSRARLIRQPAQTVQRRNSRECSSADVGCGRVAPRSDARWRLPGRLRELVRHAHTAGHGLVFTLEVIS